ncbi:MAG: DNA-directed RNA polymerase subunit omega [Clostridia bacterium]|nr:DNA-directed RNA polymerase subunit omega [Clostridia bacterium]
MLYPSVTELIKGENKCRYSLVIAVAKRARDMAAEAEDRKEKLVQKPVKLAVQSFADGEVDFREPKNL